MKYLCAPVVLDAKTARFPQLNEKDACSADKQNALREAFYRSANII